MESEAETPNEEMGKKITVFGIGGAGSVFVMLLQKMGIFSEIICVDSNLQRAKQFIRHWENVKLISTKGEKPWSRLALLKKLEGSVAVINTATSEANADLMKTARLIKANYLDGASKGNQTAEQEAFHKGFEKDGRRALFNAAIAPGLTNLMAAELMEGLEQCEIRIFVAEHTETKKLIFLWSPALAIDEGLSPVYFFGNNKPTHYAPRKPFSSPEKIRFPNPLGEVICYLVNENEGLTLQNLKNVKSVETKCGGADIERLISLVKKTQKRICQERLKKLLTLLPPTPTPKQVTEMLKSETIKDGQVGIIVEARGINPTTEELEERRATWKGVSLLEIQKLAPGATHISYLTALLMFLFFKRMMLSKQIKPGVWPPEKIKKQDRILIFKELEEMKMPVHFQM